MDIKGAGLLLDETFNHGYNLDRFQNFITELFNGFEIKQSTRLGSGVYADYIKEYTVLGEYRDSSNKKIDVLVVELIRASSRDRARSMQRNFIAKHLVDSNKDAALVAFYGYDPEDWRFSFVKMDYVMDSSSGKLEIKTELTPVKRYSYLVGINEPNHTCKSQFVDLIKNDSATPLLEEIEAAFSIEKVTKEFFEKYKQLFIELKESIDLVLKKDNEIKNDFDDKGITTIDFAKKLLGQIVFIYFLQKKGWLGVGKNEENGKLKEWGTGSKSFLRNLFDKKIVPYDNFFNDILEPLFYDALAVERDKHYYTPFKCKIPFLNGGLFEPMCDYNWQETELLIDNSVFEKILDTFDEFNFTVKEDEPLEKEVAVDPEMLGKVFENLLDVIDRKSKGAFYTPREIVHYMCQQSLINYLETNTHDFGVSREDIETFIYFSDFASSNDQKLLVEIAELIEKIATSSNKEKIEKDLLNRINQLNLPKSILLNKEKIDKLLAGIKVVDPAVGSGAFPVGMMNEIVKARSVLSTFLGGENNNGQKTFYKLKRQTIENCLYGVDIDSSAVDITKLRFWLSLIVDENDINNIKPLPNLDHKIMCGNSLLEEFEGIKLFDENMLAKPEKNRNYEIEQIDSKIENLNQQLHEIYTGKTKDTNKDEIKNEISKLEKKKKKIQSSPSQNVQQLALDQVESYRKSESQHKLSELKRLHKKYFDEHSKVVKDKLIKQIDDLEWNLIEETLKESGNEESILKLHQYKKSKSKPFFLWKLYFAEVFERENPGFDVVIANPPYVGEKGHKEIFRPIANSEFGNRYYQAKIDIFYFFFHKSIDIGRKNSSIAFITTNYYVTATGATKLRLDFKARTAILNLLNFNEFKIFDSAKGQHNMITVLKKVTDDTILANTFETKRLGLANENILKSILAGKDEETEYYHPDQNQIYDGDDNYIRIKGKSSDTSNINQILEKISKQPSLLGQILNINSGCDVTISKITKKHCDNYKGNFNLGDGVFCITENEVDLISPSIKEKSIIKPFIKNSDIYKYTLEPSNTKLIYLKWEDDIEKYPALKNHLLKFKDILIDQVKRYNENYPWFALHRPRDENIFTCSEKIVVPYRSKSNIFGYYTDKIYSSRDVFFLTSNGYNIDLKYLLALLNSKLYYVWLYEKGKRKGETLELYQKPLSEVPIMTNVKEEKISPIILLVNEILEITKSLDYLQNLEKQSKVQNLQKQIDQLVYQLYELTPEEIEIVENFNSNN